MTEFRVPALEDKCRMDEILSKSSVEGSFYSFAAIYIWAERYHKKIAFHKDALLTSGMSEPMGHFFLYPAGEYDLDEMLEIMREEAKRNDSELRIVAESLQVKELYSKYPDAFVIEESRGDWDYVYNSSDLAELPGNRYHRKRNHVSRLIKKHPDAVFSLVPITENNIAQCMEIEEAWIRDKGDDLDFESVSCALYNMDKLGLSGGILLMDDKPIAFTAGEPIGKDTFVIHIEKALSGYDGAYQMINQYFAKTIADKYRYINREEDMGIEGLRSSKMSYLPCKMIEKFVITERKVSR